MRTSPIVRTTISRLSCGRIRLVVGQLGFAIACLAAALHCRAQSPTADNFNPGADGAVGAFAVQPDGTILVGGNFTTLAGQSRSYIGRLHADGSLDTSFNPGASSFVYCLAVQADGKIVVGGAFGTLGGQPRSRLGRL